MKKRILSVILAGLLTISNVFVVNAYSDIEINTQDEIIIQEDLNDEVVDVNDADHEDQGLNAAEQDDTNQLPDESEMPIDVVEDVNIQTTPEAIGYQILEEENTEEENTEEESTEEENTEEDQTDLVTLNKTEYKKNMLDESFYLDFIAKDGVVLTYTSSKENVVYIETDGKIVIKGAGEATVKIDALYEDGENEPQNQQIEANIIVSKVDQKISMSTSTITKKYGSAKFQVKASANTPVTFKSSNENVLKVDKKGYVTITAKNSTRSAYVIVNAPGSDIYNAAPQKKVLIKWAKADQKITVGKTSFQLGNKNKSLGAAAKTGMSFKSSNNSVATVNSKGQITAKKVGTTKITITAKSSTRYNSVRKTFTIKVTKKSQTVSAANKTYTVGTKNKSLGAKAKTTLTYKSSNSSVVSVSSKGKITAKKAGTAKITITAKNTKTYQSAKKTITITVRPKATTISKLSSSSEKKMSVTVKKGSSISGYQIRYARTSSMSGAKTIATSSTKKTISISEVGNKSIKYYVQVRTYKTVSGKKYYSAWSPAKSINVKGHSHSWKASYKTISHPATGHFENIEVEEARDEPVMGYRTICNGCSCDLTDYNAPTKTLHLIECYPGSCEVQYIQVDTIYYPAETQDIWVEDTKAWDEKVLIGYKCTGCGATKQ